MIPLRKVALWSPAGKGRTSWLSCVVSNYEFVTFPLVYWVKCGTRLYWLLSLHPYLLWTKDDCFEIIWKDGLISDVSYQDATQPLKSFFARTKKSRKIHQNK